MTILALVLTIGACWAVYQAGCLCIDILFDTLRGPRA